MSWRVGGLARAVLAASTMLLLGACGGETHAYRYRLTLEVDDNGTRRVASNVVEVRVSVPSAGAGAWTAGPSVQERVLGDALVIRLTNGKLLIGSLKAFDWNMPSQRDPRDRNTRLWGENSPYEVLKLAYGIVIPSTLDDADDFLAPYRRNIAEIQRRRGARDIPFAHLPDLVTFADPEDPSTVSIVDPNSVSDSLGAGVRLVRATIEVTDDPVTRDIDQHLAWVPAWTDELGEGSGGNSVATRMNSLWFRME